MAYLFYLLFFLVPLIFSPVNSELFEYPKMMLTYGLTIIIMAIWLIKMILAKKIIYKRTFLEIPLLLYLGSHILSTIYSIDPHVSFWGYYSRFHEGLLASICYVLLYFAAVSNLTKEHVKKIFYVSLFSAAIVSVWAILEHFGGSISCILTTGKFNDDCWVQDVRNRVFATLGQPNWLAAYLDILILIALSFKNKISFLSIPFFLALLFTKSRSGILGLGAGLGIFLFFYFKKINKSFLVLLFLLTLLVLFFGLPFAQTEKYSLERFLADKQQITNNKQQNINPDLNISESGDIRKVVWTGALKIWQRYPVFGSGVETFGYAYYLDRPIEHNLLSEWDFLYNKAHNEYLNLLSTTGTVGIITYFFIILSFGKFPISNFKFLNNFQIGLTAAYISILVTNFFGFSVVIIGLYFFLIPAFYEILSD